MWMFSESEPGKRLERLRWNIQDIWNDKAKFDAEKTSNARKGRELQAGKGKTTGVNRRKWKQTHRCNCSVELFRMF